MNTRSSKTAEALFKKEDKRAAMSEHDRRRKAELEKTARLRALRLAKEAADREATAQAAAAKAAAKKPLAGRRKTVAVKDAVSA